MSAGRAQKSVDAIRPVVTEEGQAVAFDRSTWQMRELTKRLPLSDLIIYELMADDFTAGYRQDRAPLDAVQDKLDYLNEIVRTRGGALAVVAVGRVPWPPPRNPARSMQILRPFASRASGSFFP